MKSVLRNELRHRYRHSLLALPGLYLVAAFALGVLMPELDGLRNATEGAEGAAIGTARDILGATAAGMIAFTGLVVTSVLAVVQFAAGQYSPRLVLWFRRDALLKHAFGIFVATPVYALVALRVLEREQAVFSPELTIAVALVLLGSATLLFLALLQRVTDRINPRTLYRALIREGIRAAREVYPQALGEVEAPDRSWISPDPQEIPNRGHVGVVTSFDRTRLVALAEAAGTVLEVVPGVGEFVGPDATLLRVHGPRIDPSTLAGTVRVFDDRTTEQDPAFAMRIVVDTAIRALSPAVNDPTTAVNGLDVLEVIVRELAARDLEASLARDADGSVRLVWRTASWDDLLELAFDEIREYGATSIQICRRLRAVLEDLLLTTPERRHAGLREHLARLDAAVLRAFPPGTHDHATAMAGDRSGVGLERVIAASG